MNTATFNSITDLAEFCAELVRQGVTFNSVSDNGTHTVTFTGGY